MSAQSSLPQPPNQSNTPSQIHLPTEVILRILYFAVLPPPLCPAHLFGKCFDPWSCLYGTSAGHNDARSQFLPQALTPDPSLTSISYLFHHEAYKFFYNHNLFIVSPSTASSNPQPVRLVNTVANNTGSLSFEHCLRSKKVDEYRHLIRHLALMTTQEWVQSYPNEWGWPLQVDFAVLPNLETLYLDMRGFSDINHMEPHEILSAGLQRLAGLGLKKLVVVGGCSYARFGKELYEQATRRLYTPALRAGGELLLWDELCKW